MLKCDPALKSRSRALRHDSTFYEQRLWWRIRRKQLLGVQFYRQKPLGSYIVDFYAPRARLVVEIDGSQHFEPDQESADRTRAAFLEGRGLRVLRFDNGEIFENLESVVEKIYPAVKVALNPPYPPSPKGGKTRVEGFSSGGK